MCGTQHTGKYNNRVIHGEHRLEYIELTSLLSGGMIGISRSRWASDSGSVLSSTAFITSVLTNLKCSKQF